MSMAALRLLLMVAYISYLVQVGMLMVWLPWSRLWPLLLTKMPVSVALVLDAPAVRGGLTAFGILHLVMVAVELYRAGTGRIVGNPARPY